MYFLLHRRDKKTTYVVTLIIYRTNHLFVLGSGATYYPLTQTKNSQGTNINYLSLGHEK
jgi:hypothetical protein